MPPSYHTFDSSFSSFGAAESIDANQSINQSIYLYLLFLSFYPDFFFVVLQGQQRSLVAHGLVTPSPWLPSSPTTAVAHHRGRAFSSGSTPAGGEAEPLTAAGGGGFPWRRAPPQFVEPAGSGSFLDTPMSSLLYESCLKGVDFRVSGVGV